jgi:hypothetical protein
MTPPKSPAIRRLMASPAVRAACPIVKDWLAALLLRGEKADGRIDSIRREEAPVAEASDPGP